MAWNSRWKRALALLSITAFIGGCTIVFGGGIKKQPEEDVKKKILAFAYFDLDDAPGSHIEWFEVTRYESGKQPEYWSFGSPGDGLVAQTTFRDGAYKFSGMSVRSGPKLGPICFFCSWTKLDFGQLEGGFRVPQGAKTYYLGAWRYINKSTFFSAKFDLEAIKGMSEKEVIQRLLPRIGKFGSETARMRLEARLKELK